MLLEEQTSRNALLEKRARKFDNELNLVNEERKAELSSKDKLQKEVDQLKSIKNQLEDQIQVSQIFIFIPTLFWYCDIYLYLIYWPNTKELMNLKIKWITLERTFRFISCLKMKKVVVFMSLNVLHIIFLIIRGVYN